MPTLRIGVLGAARITPFSLITPARQIPEVQVAAVAARDPARAAAFARRHGIPTVHETYDDLIAAPDLDAVYIALPNSLHARWTRAAVAAGKHVLCEKPFTCNADEARAVAAGARGHHREVMEALHYRYHPLARRMADIADRGVIGRLRHVEAAICVPMPFPDNIRYKFELGGGAAMDLGVYAVHMLRLLTREEPEVRDARALLRGPQVDRAISARLAFPGGATGALQVSLWSQRLLAVSVRALGSSGELRVTNPVLPQLFHRLRVRTAHSRSDERFSRTPTYLWQLRAFSDAVLRGGPVLTPAEDAVATMSVIDALYGAAGLAPRAAEAATI